MVAMVVQHTQLYNLCRVPQVPWGSEGSEGWQGALAGSGSEGWQGFWRAQAEAHPRVRSIQKIPGRTSAPRLRRRDGWLEPRNFEGARPGSWPAARLTPPAAPSRPYLGWAGFLDRKRDHLDGSIERLLLVRLPPERQELQVFPRRWGSGPFHGRAEER